MNKILFLMRRNAKVWALVALVLLVAVVLTLQSSAWTSMGASPDGLRLERIQASPQWLEGSFRNKRENVTDVFAGVEASDHQEPVEPIEALRRQRQDYDEPPVSGLRVTWLGHSTILLEVDGARVLIDPVWGERVSPFSFAGSRRWYDPPLPLDELPEIDVVVISHDHYDHLDYDTVLALKSLESMTWMVPLGVGAHLEYWGVQPGAIVELDWWEAAHANGVTFTATPARHFSGRAIPNPNKGETLWSGWSIAGDTHRVYYSGDTGLFDELVDIGERLGPFDFTIIESGAYSLAARDIHLGPEQAVRAHQLVRGNVMMPVHWGLFDLNAHGWTEPIERVLVAASNAKVTALSIRPGEMVEPMPAPAPVRWWPDVPWNTAAIDPITSTGVEHLLTSIQAVEGTVDTAEKFDVVN